nr:SIS domain-containing protein [Staphylococcus canis]
MWRRTNDIVCAQQSAFETFIQNIVRDNPNKRLKVMFTGAGSSAYVGDVARMARRNDSFKNFDFESVPTTHLVTNPEVYINDETAYLIVSFARSGNSPETKATVEIANQLTHHAYHLYITNNKDGFLGQSEESNHVFKIVLPDETNDQSLAMTSSFSSMLFAVYVLFGGQFYDTFFDVASNHFDWIEDQADQVNAVDFSKVFYVGTGLIGELTKEVSLKLNELTAGQIEIARETTLGFRHGPKAGLSDDAIFIMLRSNEAYIRQYEADIISEVTQVKDRYHVLVLDGQEQDDTHTITLPEAQELNDLELALLYLMFGQLLAAKKSVSLGLNPDNPSPDGFINRVVKGVTIYPLESTK